MKKNAFIKFLVIVLLVSLGSCNSETKTFTESDIKIIPQPVELKLNEGVFEFTKNTKLVISDDSQKEIPNGLVKRFKQSAGWDLEVVNEQPANNFIQFVVDENLEEEEYKLVVKDHKISISSKALKGFLYGLESIRQLLPIEIESSSVVENTSWVIPNVEISDKPRYKWRGLMLDVSRHFFEKDYIKQVIDNLAMHKMNVLHFHLIDDQGWRIEIKKYPKLTEIGAFRVDQEDKHWDDRRETKANEKGTYGGFYTQEDIKEIVAYAASKGIQVVPEIEMPAHVTCAIASYPELSCFGTPVGVPSGGVWPITDIYCPGKESTFEFLENVLLETMELFPSEYIHIGGDEATKTNWKKCKDCQKRMKSEGLHDVEELQSYFIKRMERFISSHGRKLIGWDEILEGGLAPGAAVMSWRGVKGGLEASAQGHDVVMTPGTHCYFDHYQGPPALEPEAWGGYTTLSKVYEFDPIVDGMTEAQKKHVLGGQANLWSEKVTTNSHSQYMIFPRLAALSETVWSPKELRNWEDFSTRIRAMFKRYEHLGINYAKSSYLISGDVQINIETKSAEVSLQNEYSNSDIRYIIGEGDLKTDGIKYEKPFKIDKTNIIKASLFENNKPVGIEFNKTIDFHKSVGKAVSYKKKSHEKYPGAGDFTMVNTLRGTHNFHDGQWQGWLNEDMEVVIDMDKATAIQKVKVGVMSSQPSGIYFPKEVLVYVSNDGKTYKKLGSEKLPYTKNSTTRIKDVEIAFETINARYIKVIASNLMDLPSGGGVWLFVDEIIIE